eukprot:m.186813 g.186813  ORF g.186813 m.186813 type:complete len:263 (-) comp14762_c0_seq1:244-1032(-)
MVRVWSRPGLVVCLEKVQVRSLRLKQNQPPNKKLLLFPKQHQSRVCHNPPDQSQDDAQAVQQGAEGTGTSVSEVAGEGEVKSTPTQLDSVQPAARTSTEGTSEMTKEAVELAAGDATLKYNHYTHAFHVEPPTFEVDVAEVDDRFSFSFGFQGNYTIQLRCEETNTLLKRTGTHFQGVKTGGVYWCEVEEDPTLADQPRTTYKARGSDSMAAMRKEMASDGFGGEDSSSCSCIEGNPCQSQYSCRDWKNRFAVAKAHGWKGF